MWREVMCVLDVRHPAVHHDSWGGALDLILSWWGFFIAVAFCAWRGRRVLRLASTAAARLLGCRSQSRLTSPAALRLLCIGGAPVGNLDKTVRTVDHLVHGAAEESGCLVTQ